MRGWRYLAEHHPFVARLFVAHLAFVIALGVIHEIRIAAEVAVVLVSHGHEEIEKLADTGRRLREAFLGRQKHPEKSKEAENGSGQDDSERERTVR